MGLNLFLIYVLGFLVILASGGTMAEKTSQHCQDEPEPGFERGLTAEEIMNGNFETTEDEETRGMTIDEIIERANRMGGDPNPEYGPSGQRGGPDGPYIVQGDIAMTKEQYEQYMADWKKQEAELIAQGKIKPEGK